MELLTKLGINWQLLIAQIVNFVIVMGVLAYFVYKPLLNLLDQRSERIKKAMNEAKRLEEEARKMEAHRVEALKKIDEEAGVMLSAARAKAEAMHGEMIAKARVDAEKIVEKGRQDILAERNAALQEIQETLGKVILELTEKLLEREFSSADQKKAVQTLTTSIPALLK
jgi:F-type H+-transporting ATPase subunit b